MATRKTTTTKAKQSTQAKATEPKAEQVAVTPADEVAPDAEQEAQANTQTATPAETIEPKADQDAQAETKSPAPQATQQAPSASKPKAPEKEMPGVFVRTKRSVKSRRRAGFRFNRKGVGIALELLSEEQLKQLRDDPALEVEDCTLPIEAESEE
ncbi:hypothetical protein SAMN04487958_1124 [Vreelandella subterranea]|uniref:Uncharacterized protein n=1 Tax=Vreelandella subterranea TaxID=416874 RepID=A0A1H9W200_9GAMM|nr:HI1506-related protein [Halomonas subterranea]SES27935.1 hypothetical protein SAMN04487958_1124 [Halomonas subterranea]